MTEPKTCPKCEENLPADAPAGVCPKCLLAVGIDSLDDEGIKKTEGLSSSDPTVPLMTVRYFGDYELLEEIARGGMGVVYKGRQVRLNRIVAIKMILSGELAGQDDIERFHNEAQTAANLKHPNIVAIHEVGQHEGRNYFSMDYVEGQSLANVIQAGPPPARKAAEYVKTIAEAVHFAHQRGTLHRDLKPQNVLIDTHDQPLITDFGLARRVAGDSGLTATGAVLGTPSYMSPEQASGRQSDVGPHSDVYSLGAILYELLTGRPPFCAASAVATLRQVTDNPPIAPHKLNDDVPQDLETICLKCLEKSPHVRYHSASELAEELGRFLDHEPIQARPASPVRKLETWLRRRPWAITATASLVILLLVGVIYYQFQHNLLLQHQQSHPEYVRAAGERLEGLKTWTSVFATVYAAMIISYLVYVEKSLRLKNCRQFFDGTARVIEPKPVSSTVRLVCVAICLSLLAFGQFLLAKIIEVYVWEGLVLYGDGWGAYLGSWFALWLLVHYGKDYRRMVYGQSSPEIDSELREQIRELLLNGDRVSAIRLYRKAISAAGLAEAYRFVEHLTLQVKAEEPERYAANQPNPWRMNWRAVVICLVVEAVVLLLVRFLSGPLHPGSTASGFLGGCLLGGGLMFFVIAFKKFGRFKKNVPLLSALVVVLFVGSMTLTLQGPKLFAQSEASYAPFGWPWMAGLLAGICLLVSAYTPRRNG
jgi:serine/threonine protein kinase